jgi:dipeptidyl aminopeptidase/acylaminoacyl peptidase
MGEVYRARDHRLQRDVAIKMLPAAFSQDPDRLQRFEQEARAAATLNHPNILSVYDVGTEEGSPYIVSELLDGASLRDRLVAGALPLHKATDYAIQLARGLAAAHERGIIHRDLKPENVFITADGRVKILDFGLAKLVEPGDGLTAGPTRQAGTAPGMVMGTLGYMSPEQVRGRPADHRSDIFSFGAVLYEMLSGRRAFHHDTPADTLSAILKEDPPELTATNRAIPPALDRIVRHSLEKEPQQRFQSASDIAFHLGELTGSGSSPAIAPLDVAARGRKRLLTVLSAAAVLGLLLAAGLGFVIGRSRGSGQPPRLQQVTLQQGRVTSSRFAPDGHTIVCSARWNQGEYELYSARLDSHGLRPLGVKADRILAVSSGGEIALLQDFKNLVGFAGTGTLARVPLGGGAPRRVTEDVQYADWSRDGASLALVRVDRARGVYRLEYPAGNTLYETRGWISDIRFSHDGRSLAFVDHRVLGDDMGQVAVIPSTPGGTKKLLGPEWGSIQGIAWNTSDTEILFTASLVGLNRPLHAVSLSGAVRPLLSVPGGLIVQDVASDGRVLLNHAAERRILMVAEAGSDAQRDLTWLDWPIGLGFSSDGRQIFFTEQGTGGGPEYSVYLRGVDGSPAVRLGDGSVLALSPDDKWALSRLKDAPSQLILLPTGTGEARQLTHTSVDHTAAEWFPDGKRIAVVGTEGAGHQPRTYLVDLNGNEAPLTPEGLTGTLVTPDRRFVLVSNTTRQWQFFPVDGGAPHPATGVQPDDTPLRFALDGRTLYVARRGNLRFEFSRIDLHTGRRERLKDVGPADTIAVTAVSWPAISPDGRRFGYQYRRALSAVYVVDGLK